MGRSAPPRGWGRLLVCLGTIVASGLSWLCAPLLVGALVGPSTTWHEGIQPEDPTPVLTALSNDAAMPTPEGVAAALGSLVSATGLGDHAAISVVDTQTGQQLFTSADGLSTPASTAKLVTAAAVLSALGPAYQIPTTVVDGTVEGEVVLVGGGDPTLSIDEGGTYPGAARLDELADQVTRALGTVRPTRVVYDASLFVGDVYGPGWDPDIPTGGYGSAITALMVNGARVDPTSSGSARRSSDPALAAAEAFAETLGLPASAVVSGTAAAGARELGRVTSAPLTRLVETMLSESDNVVAECLARQVAIASGEPASFASAATAIGQVLAELGIDVAGYGLVDGSGLSRDNRLTAGLLTSILVLAAREENADLRAIYSGLAVAGYSGTLSGRYLTAETGSIAAGLARAKTGTLTGVSSLAGIIVDIDGRTLAFAVVADAVTGGSSAAKASMDRIVAALAGCGCR